MLRFATALALGAALLTLALAPIAHADEDKVLRAGIIGLDTSHVIAFTKVFNNPEATGDIARIQVVAAYPGGSPDIAASRDRIEGFTQQVREMGVEIVDSIDELLQRVDVVLLESVDGRPHLEQVKPVLRAGKPVFIDKPVAGSLADAVAIFELAKHYNVPCFSSSSLRFSPTINPLKNDERVGEVVGCTVYGPCSLESTHPDLYWYGVHGCEILYTIMGTGCASVTRVHTPDTDVVTGVWDDGRVATFRGIRRGKSGYGGLVFGTKNIVPVGNHAGYEPLLVEVARFFLTGEPPVPAEETIELFTFMEAADESKRQGGVPVSMASVLEAARAEARAKIAE